MMNRLLPFPAVAILALAFACLPSCELRDDSNSAGGQGAESGPEVEDILEPGFMPEGPSNLLVQVEMIELDHPVMTRLFLDRELQANATDLRLEVQALVDNGKGRVVQTVAVTTKTATRARVESVRECSFPSQIHPPKSNPKFPVEKRAPLPPESAPEAPKGGEPQPKDTAKSNTEIWPPGFFPTPGGLMNRSVGLTLEVDPLLGNDKRTIDITVAPSYLQTVGEEILQKVLTPQGEVTTFTTPRFYTSRVQTAITARDGEYALLGVISPADKDGNADESKKYLVFLRVSVLTLQYTNDEIRRIRKMNDEQLEEPDPFE